MKVSDMSKYSFGGETELGFDDAVAKVTEALKEEGFGVLTEIDAKKVLKEKLGLDREPQLGTLLPCNVLVYETDEGGVVVSAMNPESALNMVDNPQMGEIAKEVSKRIRAALQRL